MGKLIGYSDFIRICQIDDPKNCLSPGLDVRTNGVWVVPPPDDVLLTPEERAILSDHPKKDLAIPALSFPCSIEQLEGFLAFYGIPECIDSESLSEFENGSKPILIERKVSKAPPPIKTLKGTGVARRFCKPKPDYQYWQKLSYWNLFEASRLLCDCDPKYKEKLSMGERIDPGLDKKVSGTYEIVYRAFMADELKRASAAPNDKMCVDPCEFLKWANSRGFNLPEELSFLYQTSFKSSDNPSKKDLKSERRNKHTNQTVIMKHYFPALSIEPLRLRARRWAETFYSNVPIENILLYAYSSRYAGATAERQRGYNHSEKHQLPKYAIIFEIDADDETQQMSMEEEREHIMNKVRGLVPERPWDKLLRDIHYHETASDNRYPQLLQPDFCSVYKNPPGQIPYWEWVFKAKFRNTELQDSVRDEHFEPHVVLYTRSGIIEEIIAFSDDVFLPDSELTTKCQNQEWQEREADWAIRNQFIGCAEIVCIMAYDESYIPIIPQLWKVFQMDILGDNCPDPKTFGARINIWTAIFNRWTQNDILGINQNNIRIYTRKKLRIGKVLELKEESGVYYIELSKLRDYFSETAKIHAPVRLFPKQCKSHKSNGVSDRSQKPRKSQIRIQTCQQIADSLWRQDESITITSMYERPEIIQACEGNLPAIKTFRRWMKGRCPNRNPGRRPTKKGT